MAPIIEAKDCLENEANNCEDYEDFQSRPLSGKTCSRRTWIRIGHGSGRLKLSSWFPTGCLRIHNFAMNTIKANRTIASELFIHAAVVEVGVPNVRQVL